MRKLGLCFGIYLLLLNANCCDAMKAEPFENFRPVFAWESMQEDNLKLKLDKEKKQDELIKELYNINCIKFGEFILKSGQKSPVYVDLRPVMSHPKVFKLLVQQACNKILWEGLHNTSNIICGVPDGAVPLATRIAGELSKPLIMKRKEAKEHGTKKMIEGDFEKGDRVLIIEDVITTGGSILEVKEALGKEELSVTDAFVCLDREQKGRENLIQKGCNVHALFTINDVLDALFRGGNIDSGKRYEISTMLRLQS